MKTETSAQWPKASKYRGAQSIRLKSNWIESESSDNLKLDHPQQGGEEGEEGEDEEIINDTKKIY